MENKELKDENDLLKTQLEPAVSSHKEENEELAKQLQDATELVEEDINSKKDEMEKIILKSYFGNNIDLLQQFQELAKKHVYVIAYAEEQQYFL